MIRPYTQHGFGMMQILILTVVVSLIYNLAFPTYERYMARQNRIQAKNALQKALDAEQRYMSQYQKYLAYTTANNETSAAGLITFSGNTVELSSHRISAQGCADSPSPLDTTACIEVIATPFGMPGIGQRIGGAIDAECGALIMDSYGNQYIQLNGARISGNDKPECWQN